MYAANYSLVFPCQSNDLAMGTSEHAKGYVHNLRGIYVSPRVE